MLICTRARSRIEKLTHADAHSRHETVYAAAAAEAAAFLTQVMGLTLSAENIAALEARTEGWIAGLQLAALSIQGQPDTAGFIRSFSGSHRFVLDYLLEEVLGRQPEHIQTFLLRTSILERMCGPLCDAILLDSEASGQATLDYLERANLFLVPLDNERRWYRYHQLFAELLRQRLHQSFASSTGDEGKSMAELHLRASVWYEEQGLEIEAFQHAAAAQDVERAARLLEGKGMPLYFRGAVAPVLHWLESLPASVLDAMPSLWVRYASLLLVKGQAAGVEEKLQAAEAALQGSEADEQTRNLLGEIAATRATLALARYQVEAMLAQSRRALEYLHPNQENKMSSVKMDARVAGGLYLIIIVGGLFVIGYIPAAIVVAGDAAATAHNIAAHELLYRFGLAAHMFILVCNSPLALIFYDLFKVVSRRLALLVVFFSQHFQKTTPRTTLSCLDMHTLKKLYSL